MSEMVERVAKAMAVADGKNTMWPVYGDMARAAIEAMRDPSIDMVVKGDTIISHGNIDNGSGAIWSCMIDEALRA